MMSDKHLDVHIREHARPAINSANATLEWFGFLARVHATKVKKAIEGKNLNDVIEVRTDIDGMTVAEYGRLMEISKAVSAAVPPEDQAFIASLVTRRRGG